TRVSDVLAGRTKPGAWPRHLRDPAPALPRTTLFLGPPRLPRTAPPPYRAAGTPPPARRADAPAAPALGSVLPDRAHRPARTAPDTSAGRGGSATGPPSHAGAATAAERAPSCEYWRGERTPAQPHLSLAVRRTLHLGPPLGSRGEWLP